MDAQLDPKSNPGGSGSLGVLGTWGGGGRGVGCRQRLVLERLFEFEFEFELEQPLAFDRLFDLELPPP